MKSSTRPVALRDRPHARVGPPPGGAQRWAGRLGLQGTAGRVSGVPEHVGFSGTSHLRKRRLALVLWNGAVGGAESFTVALAQRLRDLGADVVVVFITGPHPLAERVHAAGLPFRSLGFTRGRDVAWHPRRYAREVARLAPDGALLGACGFMGAALRCGGYRGPIVAVEHGALLSLRTIPWLRRCLLRLGGIGGAWTTDAEIGVSDFMLGEMRRHAHARKVQRIRNGIDPSVYTSATTPGASAPAGVLSIGCAGRLIPGKGVDCLIEAVARLQRTYPISLAIAGEGPERTRLEALAGSIGIAQVVHFVGLVSNMAAFWQASDVAVVPSEMTESFSMTTLEAMASGKPVLATRNGGICEVVVNGETGTLVPAGNVEALAGALRSYADADLRARHGLAGRARAEQHFHIDASARAYLRLFDEIATRRPRRAGGPGSQ
jgi:glycosyltransferase involved in cell wall biosynthesis